MLFPLTPDDLTTVLEPDEVLRADPAVAAEVIGDRDAVAFLSEVGVPWCSGAFQMGSTLAAASTSDDPDLLVKRGALPMVIDTPVGELGSLGSLLYTSVYLRRNDGVVFATSENNEEGYEQINSDVSSLSKMLLLIETKSPDPDLDYDEAEELYREAAEAIEAEIRSADPTPFADPKGFWTTYLESYASGMYPRLER